eukprot:539094-Pelagomonas_calceolata.AAC.1
MEMLCPVPASGGSEECTPKSICTPQRRLCCALMSLREGSTARDLTLASWHEGLGWRVCQLGTVLEL